MAKYNNKRNMFEFGYLNDVFRREGKTEFDGKVSDILSQNWLVSGFPISYSITIIIFSWEYSIYN